MGAGHSFAKNKMKRDYDFCRVSVDSMEQLANRLCLFVCLFDGLIDSCVFVLSEGRIV